MLVSRPLGDRRFTERALLERPLRSTPLDDITRLKPTTIPSGSPLPCFQRFAEMLFGPGPLTPLPSTPVQTDSATNVSVAAKDAMG